MRSAWIAILTVALSICAGELQPARAAGSPAIEEFQRKANQGDRSAQNYLGNAYYHGQGVAQDYAEALKWYRKAAEQGLARAQNNLGVMYYHGQGVAQDYAEAVKWYRKAAEQGLAIAQNNLGLVYANGRGVAQDYAKAVKWYRKAAEQGLAKASTTSASRTRSRRSARLCRSGEMVSQGCRAGSCQRSVQPRRHVCRGSRRCPGLCRSGEMASQGCRAGLAALNSTSASCTIRDKALRRITPKP